MAPGFYFIEQPHADAWIASTAVTVTGTQTCAPRLQKPIASSYVESYARPVPAKPEAADEGPLLLNFAKRFAGQKKQAAPKAFRLTRPLNLSGGSLPRARGDCR